MSNAFDKASLVMLPHAYEEGKLYSLKPTDRSGDFTFSRGADTATRVGEDGYIKKEHSNLLLQSNQFDTTWSTANASVTGGQAGYDGSSDAWLLENNQVANSSNLQQIFSSSSVNAYSVYAKAGTTNWLNLRTEAAGNSVWFDLGNGVIGTEKASTISSSIESVGDGWYRLSIAFDSCTAVRFYVADGNNSFAVTLGANVYIQDAQLNQGLVADPYLETTTAPVYGGLTDNMPRLDYTDATCPSLLLEPSRTNLIGYSEAIEFGISTNECTQTITNETNPSGNNASYLASAINDNNNQIRYDRNGLSSGSYFLSAFVKGDGNANKIRVRGTGGGVSVGNVYWDVAADGTISLNTSDSPSGVNAITESYGNGWYRIGFEETFDGIGRFAFYPSNGDVNASTYIWGIQWEAGSYPTSYIPTYGSAQTRPKDSATADITNITDSTEGTIFTEFAKIQDFSTFQLDDGTQNNRITLYPRNNTSSITFIFTIGGVQVIRQDPSPSGLDTTEFNKYAIAWGLNDFRVYVNGVKIYTSTSNITFASGALTDLDFYQYNNKEFLLFPTALSDEECIALTQN